MTRGRVGLVGCRSVSVSSDSCTLFTAARQVAPFPPDWRHISRGFPLSHDESRQRRGYD